MAVVFLLPKHSTNAHHLNDISNYFSILTALFSVMYLITVSTGPAVAAPLSPVEVLNIMNLKSPESAILSAVIFNALIIVALIPLALKGVKCRAQGANRIVLRNLLIYGLGGILTPFLGIKLIDLLITAVGWV